MTQAQTEVLQAIIQSRNEAIEALHSSRFNPATQPAEYRVQQQLIEDLQAQHVKILKEIDRD